MLGWDAVADVRWEHLFHAYGVAVDTPEYVRGLTSEDASERAAAVNHLYAAVLHQGTIYPATAPVVRWVSGSLDACLGSETLVSVLEWLADVAGSLAWLAEVEAPEPPDPVEVEAFFEHMADEDDPEYEDVWGSPMVDVLMAGAVIELRQSAPEVVNAILPLIGDPNPAVWKAAAWAAAEWSRSAPEELRAEVSAVIAQRLPLATDRNERASVVLALGQAGGDVSAYLLDPDAAVSACAALFVQTPQATGVLIDALTHPGQVNSWFDSQDRPAFFPMHTRYTLLAEVIGRQVTIEELLPAAVPLIAASHGGLAADSEWGPILQLAFPDAGFRPGVRPPLPERLTSAQRTVLEALAANESLWNPRDGNASLARMKVGAPDDRTALLEYLRSERRDPWRPR